MPVIVRVPPGQESWVEVLEDLETPYSVLQERKEQEKAREERRKETKAANKVKKAIYERRR